MRYIAPALFVLAVFGTVTFLTVSHDETLDPVIYEYMTENFYDDTSAHNGIAAILLNYRMYDTLFEALILLTAIIGMLQFLPGVASKHEREASGPDGEDR